MECKKNRKETKGFFYFVVGTEKGGISPPVFYFKKKIISSSSSSLALPTEQPTNPLAAAPGPGVALEDLVGGVPSGLQPLRDEQRRGRHDDGAKGDGTKRRVDVAGLGGLGERSDDVVDLGDVGKGGGGGDGGALRGDVGAAGGRGERRL